MSELRVSSIVNEAGTGSVEFAQGASVPAGKSFTANVTGDVYSTGISTLGAGSTVTGTLFTDQIGVAGVSTLAGLTTVTGPTLFAKQLNVSGVSTTASLDIKAAVETVSVAATYQNGSFNNVVVECDFDLGTVFTHNIGTNGIVGVVSIRDFPVIKNSATTYCIIFTQNSTGTGNTTGTTGIGTNIFLKPSGVTGFSTSARVGSASTTTLSSTGNDTDIVSLMVHYNGGATGTQGNYVVYASNNGSFRYGNVTP